MLRMTSPKTRRNSGQIRPLIALSRQRGRVSEQSELGRGKQNLLLVKYQILKRELVVNPAAEKTMRDIAFDIN